MKGYESPIMLMAKELNLQIEKKLTGEVLKATQAVGVEVDKDELIKALSYDREQYDIGFREGYEARENEIVRCKDCNLHNNCIFEETFVIARMENPFCCVGKRKE